MLKLSPFVHNIQQFKMIWRSTGYPTKRAEVLRAFYYKGNGGKHMRHKAQKWTEQTVAFGSKICIVIVRWVNIDNVTGN